MPCVFVYVKSEIYEQVKLMHQFVNNLPEVIAETLSTGHGTKGELKPDEIGVFVRSFGRYDIHHYDIEVLILANDYPERLNNLNDRAKDLAERASLAITMTAMQSLGPNVTIKGFVWPFLGKGAFQEFSKTNHL